MIEPWQLILACIGSGMLGAIGGFIACACCVVASDADERMGRDS